MLATLVVPTESVRQLWTEAVRQLWTEAVRRLRIVTPTRILVPAVLILPPHQRTWPKAKDKGKGKSKSTCL
jgi:hypothetical protein